MDTAIITDDTQIALLFSLTSFIHDASGNFMEADARDRRDRGVTGDDPGS